MALDEAQVAWPVVYTQNVQSDVSVDAYGTGEGERETVSQDVAYDGRKFAYDMEEEANAVLRTCS